MDKSQIVFILYITIIPHILSECDWPANLRDSVWHDSDKGQLDFETKTMSGLDYLVENTLTLNDWDCLYYYQSSGILIMKSQDTVTIFSTVYRPFQCIKLTAITNYSYYYYVQAGTDLRIGGERIMVKAEADVSTITETNAVSRLCGVSGTASDTEYHVLLKDNQEENAAQVCPGIFQDEFWYKVNDGGTTSCGSQNERWDVCTDTSTMLFDYSMCSTQIAYSSSGIVRCMATITTGDSTLTTVMNTDTSPTYLFTCFMSKVSATGTILVSQSPKSCTLGQTPETQPVHPDGTQGLLLELTAHATSACDPTTTTTTTTPTTTTTTTIPTPTTTTTKTTTTTHTVTSTTPRTTTKTPTVTSTTPRTTHMNYTAASTVSAATTTPPTTNSSTITATSTTSTTTTTTTFTVTPRATSPAARSTSAPTTNSTPNDNTLIILAAVLSGVANFLIVILIVGIVLYIACRRKRQTRPLPTI